MRPLSVGEILDAAFSSFRRNFGRLALAVLVVVVPVAVVQVLVVASLGGLDNTIDYTDYRDSTTTDGAEVAGLIVYYLLALIELIVAPTVCLRIVGADIMGNHVTWKESLSYAVRRLPRIAWVTVLYVLAIGVGWVLCILPGVWLFGLLSMALPVALFEDARGAKALGRSRDLVRDLWWRTFGTLFLLLLLIVVVRLMLVTGIVGGLVLNSDNGVLAGVLLALSTILSSVLTLPLWAATSAYLYFDLRVRKEGFDLMMMAGQIEPASAGGRPEVEGLPPSDTPPTGGGFLPPQAPGG